MRDLEHGDLLASIYKPVQKYEDFIARQEWIGSPFAWMWEIPLGLLILVMSAIAVLTHLLLRKLQKREML